MENFDLESHLQGVYLSLIHISEPTLIGLTANYEGIDATLRERYYKQVVEAGGVPVIVPPVADTAVIITLCGWARSLRPVCTTSIVSAILPNSCSFALPSIVRFLCWASVVAYRPWR